MNRQLVPNHPVVQMLMMGLLLASSVAPLAAEEATADKVGDAAFFQPGKVQVIHLDVSESNLARMKAALPERIYVPADFRWGEQTIRNVGVRYKGNSSSQPNQRHKRSFLIKFNEFEKGQRFLGLKRVAMDNGVQFGSLFSEQLITRILDELDIVASRANFARLYLNGKFHGVYTNVERIDSVFLANHFADPGGPLYKIDEGGPGCDLGPVPEAVRARGVDV